MRPFGAFSDQGHQPVVARKGMTDQGRFTPGTSVQYVARFVLKAMTGITHTPGHAGPLHDQTSPCAP